MNRNFLLLCKELSLFGGEEVAVDGSFFSGNSSKGSIYTEKRLNKQIESLDKKIAAYQEAISKQDAADDGEGRENSFEDGHLVEKLRLLQEKQAEKQALKTHFKDSKEKHLSTIDKNAGLLKTRTEHRGLKCQA